MDSTWSNPDFLQQSSDEYLASLQNFLDGQDSSFTTSSFDPNASLTAFANSLQSGPSGGGAFASPGKPNNTTFDALSAFGGNNGFPAASDIQINPSLLGSLPGYNHGLTGINTANEPSSPELTSASSSADSPASSADAPAPSTHHHQQQTGTRGSTRRVVSGGSNSAASGSGAGAGHDKRKAPQQGSGAVKDRKSVGGGGASGSTHHSHPTGEDDELERSESPELPAGKGAKGKTSERRRAQNRQAQRNFRERKEKHLKDLETRVLDLESKTQTQESENSALKAVLEQLRSENARLRVFETAFTFNYNKDVDGSAAMPQAQVFGGPAGAGGLPPSVAALPAGLAGPGARPLPQHQPRSTGPQLSPPSSVGAGADKPPTPPTAQDELDDVTAAFKFDTSSLGFGLSGAGAPPANEFASPLPSPPSATSNPSSAAAQQQTADDLFASFTLPSPPSLSSSSSAAAPSISSTLPSTSASAPSPYPTAQFTAYRDPLPALLGSTTAAQPGLTTFADFDALFGVGVGGAPASSSAAEDPLAAFLSSTGTGGITSGNSANSSAAPSPSATLPLGASPSMFPSSHLAPSPGQSAGAETAVCGMIKEAQAQARKRGEKFEFDLDGLCSEMKLKATCQEAARQALKSAMAEDAAASRMTYPGRQI